MHLPFLPAALTTKKPPPKWDPFTPIFSRLSQSATTHPVQTLVIVALLASTTYIQMLEHSLFDNGSSFWGQSSHRADLMDGSVKVAVGEQTAWSWKENAADEVTGAKHLALVTLSFPRASLETSPLLPAFSDATEIVSADPLTKVYAVPIEELPEFINTVRVVPTSVVGNGEKRQWTMQSERAKRSGNVIARAEQVINDLWEVIKVSHYPCARKRLLTASRMLRPSMSLS